MGREGQPGAHDLAPPDGSYTVHAISLRPPSTLQFMDKETEDRGSWGAHRKKQSRD